MTIDQKTYGTYGNLRECRWSLWENHPAVTANAVVTTPPLEEAVQLVLAAARRNRSSLAFWGEPLAGKSFALQAIRAAMAEAYPGIGMLNFEPSEKERNTFAEGTFIEGLLGAAAFDLKPARSLEGKRTQLLSLLWSVGEKSGRLLLMIDEAQGLHAREFIWLKRLINLLAKRHIIVTVVLFGQRELKEQRKNLQQLGRSDLCTRFMRSCREFRGIRTSDLKGVLSRYDSDSLYPDERGWTFTHFLWPQAYEAGFRLATCADQLGKSFLNLPGAGDTIEVGMPWLAHSIAELADLTRDKDRPLWVPNAKDWDDAVIASGFYETADKM